MTEAPYSQRMSSIQLLRDRIAELTAKNQDLQREIVAHKMGVDYQAEAGKEPTAASQVPLDTAHKLFASILEAADDFVGVADLIGKALFVNRG